MTPAELLARRSLIAVVPVSPRGERDTLRDPLTAVALASPDHTTALVLDDDGIALLAAFGKRTDRVFVFDEARPALQRLLSTGVDVARPVCRSTLEKLLDVREGHPHEMEHPIAREVGAAGARASQVVHRLDTLLARVEERGLKKVARLECLVLRAFAALEHRGLPIDRAGWAALVDEAKALAAAAKEQVVSLGGTHVSRDLFGTPEINLDADADVRALLSRVLGRPIDGDLGRATLTALKQPIADALLRYRDAQKIVTSYGATFLDRIDARTGRIHAHFIPLGASTGRVASRDPNLQNLPSDARFHHCLRAPDGRVLVTADYATCELRIVAEMSGDPVFQKAFDAGEDLHATVASQMFGAVVSKTENPELRQRAKAINFGLVYGMGAPALAASLNVSPPQGQELLDRYFRTFPRIKDFLEASVEKAFSKGFAETLLGRRMTFTREELDAENARGELSRIMKNMPIQGSSADMTKLAMVRVHERLLEDTAGSAGLVNTIHDELVVECAASDGDRVAAAVRAEMEDAHRTLCKRVPPLVEVHVAPHWQH